MDFWACDGLALAKGRKGEHPSPVPKGEGPFGKLRAGSGAPGTLCFG